MARGHAYPTPGPKSRSRQTPRTSTGGPCLGARGKQAQLAQANGSKFNLLLMLVAQMSTYPRVIATHYCSWGSRNFKLTHGALTAFEEVGVVAVAVARQPSRRIDAPKRRPPTRHRNRGVVPAKRRRNDQLVQEKHMGCEAMLKFAAMLTVLHVLGVPTALVGDHYRHSFDLGRCFEARVP